MCFYILEVSICGHTSSTLLSYAFCHTLLAQLSRIDDRSSWQPETIDIMPFDLPKDCDPSPSNTYVLLTGDFCGWECRNNYLGEPGLGMPDAHYGIGSERIGVGWRAT